MAGGLLLRLGVAFGGDFVLHPDDTFQILEPAAAWVHGRGFLAWEFVFGARSPLAPLLVAGGLYAAAMAGLPGPAVVEAAACLGSMAIPAGMHAFALRAPGGSRTAARGALLFGCFWYELVVLAGRPTAGMLAIWAFWGLLGLSARAVGVVSQETSWGLVTRRVLPAALCAAACVVLRMQLLPAVAAAVAVLWLRRETLRAAGLLALCGGLLIAACGIADGVFWGFPERPFHSWRLNGEVNARFLSDLRAAGGSSLPGTYVTWLQFASGGLVLALVPALGRLSHRAGVCVCMALAAVWLPHAFLAHREYRFVLAVVPLWGAALGLAQAGVAPGWRWPLRAALGGWALAASVCGLVGALPGQAGPYPLFPAPLDGKARVARFLGTSDPYREAVRLLQGEGDRLEGVWFVHRRWAGLPGYYGLGRSVPMYDHVLGRHFLLDEDGAASGAHVRRFVSHVVCEGAVESDCLLSGFGVVATVDGGAGAKLFVLERAGGTGATVAWEGYTPYMVDGYYGDVVRELRPEWGWCGPGGPREAFGIGLRGAGGGSGEGDFEEGLREVVPQSAGPGK